MHQGAGQPRSRALSGSFVSTSASVAATRLSSASTAASNSCARASAPRCAAEAKLPAHLVGRILLYQRVLQRLVHGGRQRRHQRVVHKQLLGFPAEPSASGLCFPKRTRRARAAPHARVGVLAARNRARQLAHKRHAQAAFLGGLLCKRREAVAPLRSSGGCVRAPRQRACTPCAAPRASRRSGEARRGAAAPQQRRAGLNCARARASASRAPTAIMLSLLRHSAARVSGSSASSLEASSAGCPPSLRRSASTSVFALRCAISGGSASRGAGARVRARRVRTPRAAAQVASHHAGQERGGAGVSRYVVSAFSKAGAPCHASPTGVAGAAQ